MASAAKLAFLPPPIDDDALSPAELLARMSGQEIFDASQETSRVYNGHVIAKAIVIVQIRVHCPSLPDLARRIGVSKSIVYSHAAAHPLSDAMLHRAIRDLAILLDEEGDLSSARWKRDR